MKIWVLFSDAPKSVPVIPTGVNCLLGRESAHRLGASLAL